MYSIILPPFSMPDEGFHFAEAYRLSNAIMGLQVNDDHGYIYMRECDVAERVTCPNNIHVINTVEELIYGNLLKLCMQQERISIRQIGIIAALTFLYAPSKPVYAPLAGLVFLIPDKNICDVRWKNILRKLMILSVALIAVLLTYQFSFMSMLQIQNKISAFTIEALPVEGMAIEVTSVYQIMIHMICPIYHF